MCTWEKFAFTVTLSSALSLTLTKAFCLEAGSSSEVENEGVEVGVVTGHVAKGTFMHKTGLQLCFPFY